MMIEKNRSMFSTLIEYIRATYRSILVLSIIIVSITASLALAVLVIPFSRPKYLILNASYVLRNSAKSILFVIGINVHRDQSVNVSDTLFVSNHWGYLDSLLLMSLSPCLVISSSEVRRMPIVGFVMSTMGFFFVDRVNKRSIPSIIEKATNIADSTGLNLAFFPEGGTGDGFTLRPFHPPFFEIARQAGYSVQPIALNIVAINHQKVSPQNINKVVFHGPELSEITVIQHIIQLLRIKSIDLAVNVLQDIPFREIQEKGLNRKQICDKCETRISNNYLSAIREEL